MQVFGTLLHQLASQEAHRDDVVIALNQVAMEQMRGEAELKIVPGATHLFEEPGTLEQVAELARDWFIRHLAVR